MGNARHYSISTPTVVVKVLLTCSSNWCWWWGSSWTAPSRQWESQGDIRQSWWPPHLRRRQSTAGKGCVAGSRTWLLWKSGMQRINTLYSKKNDVSRTGEQFKHGVLSSLKAGQRKCKAEVMTKYPRKKVSIITIVIYQIFQRSKLFVKIWKWFE